MKIITLLVLTFLSLASSGNTKFFCNNKLDSLPIQQSGRVKPLYVHANETIKYLTGKSKVGEYSAVEAFCLISLNGMGMPSNIKLMAHIDHVDIKKLLDLTDDNSNIEYDTLSEQQSLLQSEWRRQKEDTSYKKSLAKKLNQINLYQDVWRSTNWLLPSLEESTISWVPFSQYMTEQRVVESRKKSSTPFLNVLEEAKANFIKIEGDSYLLELTYAKLRLPVVSLICSLLALAMLVLFKNFKFALGFAFLTVAAQTALMALRVYISGRAPITNMYETVLFSGYGSLVLALVIGHFKKEKLWVFVGLAYNVCSLMMLNFAGGMLSPRISPLVPVLRDNFWLSTHVTTIMLSYGALALSWIMANTVLIKSALTDFSKDDEKYYIDLIYTCLKYGTVLLFTGIILGGVWADYSWGRFWGWDPKETWSLIAFCIYMAILHGKYTNWIPPKRFIPLVAGAFMSVMMAWFGVNYILASGLHSYGFSEGGAVFLGSFFLIQTLILIVSAIKLKTKEA